MGALNLQISNAFSIPFPSELAKFPPSSQNFSAQYFLLALHFILKRKTLARRQGVLYMADFTSIQRRAEGGQARPQMDSV